MVTRRRDLGKGEPRGRQATEETTQGPTGRVFSWNLVVQLGVYLVGTWLFGSRHSLATQGPQIGVFLCMWI